MKGIDFDKIIRELKEEGKNQVESINFLKKKHGLSLGEADQKVLYSDAWKGYLETTVKLRDDFFKVLEFEPIIMELKNEGKTEIEITSILVEKHNINIEDASELVTEFIGCRKKI